VVIGLFAALAALAQASPAAGAAAHVRFARGAVTIAGVDAAAGAAIARGAAIETGPDAYLELALDPSVRVRVSASTRLSIEDGAIRLTAGRLWIQSASSPRPVALELPGARARIAPRSSVVAEHSRALGGALAVRAGEATLLGGDRPSPVRAREIAVLPPGSSEPARVRPGGSGLAELATREAEAALGDLLGLGTFLLGRAAKVELGSSGPRSVQDILRTDAELGGADAGAGGFLVEGALRPPPFFDEEVPPKGPNVRVEVTFGDE